MKAITLAMLLVLAGCGSSPPVPATVEAKPAKAIADAWAGRWVGPEGLVMEITAQAGGRYRVMNQYTLEEGGVFAGRVEGGAIVIGRGGKTVRIRKGTGDETGMKWLAGKADCLVVGPGEGYCRG